MIVCKNEAVRPNDESRSFALQRENPPRISARTVFVRLILEKQIVERRSVGAIIFFVTSMMTTLGATISNALAKALLS